MNIDKLKSKITSEIEDCELLSFEVETLTHENGDVITAIKLAISAEQHSYIRVEVWLPRRWNGMFIGLGNGGMAGGIPYDSLQAATNDGFAASTTDMGTSRGMKSGIHNPAVWRDFGFRSTHIMTVVGKIATSFFYGQAHAFSVYKGGSTGGQQALSEVQRYPEDYDAVLCGAPANNRVRLHTYFLWNFVHLKHRDLSPVFSEELCIQINRLALDFLKDFAPQKNEEGYLKLAHIGANERAQFVKSAERELSLNAHQTESLLSIYNGPMNPNNGERIYHGMPLGSELTFCGILDTQNHPTSPFDYPFYWALGEAFDPFKFDFDKDFDTVLHSLSSSVDANDVDVSAFLRHGGKMIIASGSIDACVPSLDIRRYLKLANATIGDDLLNSGCKFYIAPTYDHRIAGCHADDIHNPHGQDLLSAVIEWYKGQTAPSQLLVNTEQGTVDIYPILNNYTRE